MTTPFEILTRYAERTFGPDGYLYESTKVGLEVVIELGKIVGFRKLDNDPEDIPFRTRMGQRGSEPNFVVDYFDFLFGLSKNDPEDAKSTKEKDKWERNAALRHKNYMTYLGELVQKNPEIKSLKGLFDALSDPNMPTEANRVSHQDRVRVWVSASVDGVSVHQDPEVKALWKTMNPDGVMDLHPHVRVGVAREEGILCSFNDESYALNGLVGCGAGKNAPMLRSKAYNRAITDLGEVLEKEVKRDNKLETIKIIKSGVNLADGRVLLVVPKEDADKDHARLVVSRLNGDYVDTDPESESVFQFVVLCGTKGRVACIDWGELSVYRALASIRQWERDLGLVGVDFPPNISRIHEVLFSKSRPSGPFTQGVYMAKMLGEPLPCDFLNRAVSAAKSLSFDEKKRKDFKCAVSIVKLGLIRSGYKLDAKLDTNNDNFAYNNGRAFALLERLQYLSIGRSPITDEFCNMLQSPNFKYLLDNGSHHADKVGGYGGYLLSEATKLTRNSKFTLNTEEQGLFILGRYHQKVALFTKCLTAAPNTDTRNPTTNQQ